MRRRLGQVDRRVWLVVAALLLDLVVLRDQIVASIDAAVCLERANYELILCLAPPDPWIIPTAGVLSIALAVGLGTLLESARRRRP